MNLEIINPDAVLATLAMLALGCLAAKWMSQRTGSNSKDIMLALGLFLWYRGAAGYGLG